jgi:hypothetical protein
MPSFSDGKSLSAGGLAGTDESDVTLIDTTSLVDSRLPRSYQNPATEVGNNFDTGNKRN